MKFAKQLALLELQQWAAFYVDYDALKVLAEGLPQATRDEAAEHSDDSVSHTPRHARAAHSTGHRAGALRACGCGARASRPTPSLSADEALGYEDD